MLNYCSLIASRRNNKVSGRGCGSIEHTELEIDKVLGREPVEEGRSVWSLLINSNFKTNISNLQRITDTVLTTHSLESRGLIQNCDALKTLVKKC